MRLRGKERRNKEKWEIRRRRKEETREEKGGEGEDGGKIRGKRNNKETE